MKTDQERIAKLTRNLEKNAGVTPETLAQMEAHLGCVLPQQYKEFMLLSDGAYGLVGENHLILYAVEELTLYEWADVPQLIVFASNGGGEAYAFNSQEAHWPIVNVAFIGDGDVTPYGDTFLEFLELRAADEY